ncbi:hypothetical protein [Mycolicibacterium sp. P1-18]|uniref:hypothetical protein n=1 Tax=Mycolicibacterium sp. P1-18 TaxID=2024615 RepID=UPI0011F1F987|nr:hypothetical protein [Mycolicibacterium sp. P1-18]
MPSTISDHPETGIAMKIFYILMSLSAVIGVLRHVSHRLATHQRVIPNPLAHVNTQVHRINQ